MAKKRPSVGGGPVVEDGLATSVTHLLHRTLQLALDYHAEAAGPAAITQRQFTVLAAAGAADGRTQNDLVRATGIDRSTLADLVARMLAKGLLERERSTTDARANVVRLSAAGRAALGAGSMPAAAADARLLGLLTPKKRDAFLKTLGALAAIADAPDEVTIGRIGRPEKTEKPAKAPKAVKASKAAKRSKAAAWSDIEAAAKPAKSDRKKKKKARKHHDVGA